MRPLSAATRRGPLLIGARRLSTRKGSSWNNFLWTMNPEYLHQQKRQCHTTASPALPTGATGGSAGDGKHGESHFTSSETVRDIVIGMADGLTVPFALAAGLTGVAGTSIIVTAGLAEIAAGSIAMGLGGYLAAKTDAQHYDSERLRELQECATMPEQEKKEVAEIFRDYGLPEEHVMPIVEALSRDRDKWVDFMMRFELGLERPDINRAPKSAALIGGSYAVGGLVPLVPYMLTDDVSFALSCSCGATLVTLLAFGYVKGSFVGVSPWRNGLKTMAVGGLAASAAFAIANIVG